MTIDASGENITDDDKKAKPSKTFDELAGELANNVPEVQENAVAAHEARENAKKEAAVKSQKAAESTAKEKFDPKVHLTDKNGKPKLTKLGKFRKKPGARAELNVPKDPVIEAEAKAKIEAENKIAAETVQTLIRSGYKAFLDYETPDDRHKMHVDVTEAWFMAEGGVKIPPWGSVLLLEGDRMMRAVSTEKGKKATLTLREKVGVWWDRQKQKKKAKKDNGTHSSGGADNERENNGSDQTAAPTTGVDGAQPASS